MAKSFMPPLGKPVSTLLPPSLQQYQQAEEEAAAYNGSGALPNPSVVPRQLLGKLHFTFIIRHPCLSIPSLYEISTPPGSDVTGWYGFHTDDCGFREMRMLFDYFRSAGLIGPRIAGDESSLLENGDHTETSTEVCVVDAEELLMNPMGVCRAFCKSVGIEFDASMLQWSSTGDQERAEQAFEKSWAQHVHALRSQTFRAANPAFVALPPAEQDREWVKKYGEEGAEVIRRHVDVNVPHYEYLKQFAIRVNSNI